MHPELLEQIIAWHDEDKHKKIIATINAIPQKDPEAIGLLARALNNDGRYKEAAAQLELIREQSQENALWHFRMGYALFFLRRVTACQPYFERAAQLAPNVPDDPTLLEDSLRFISQAKAMQKTAKKF